MRYIMFALIVALAACEAPPNPGTSAGPPSAPVGSIASFRQVAAQIEPLAERMCRLENPEAPRNYCDIQVVLVTNRELPANAFHTFVDPGRPVIGFTDKLLASVRNPEEIAFILSHEAGHLIGNHLLRTERNSRIGADALEEIVTGRGETRIGELRKARKTGAAMGALIYSKQYELEADSIGTVIANAAGYNPMVGAQVFHRFGSPGGPLSTHPKSSERLAQVQRTYAGLPKTR